MAKKPIRRRGKEPMPGQPDTRNWYAHKKHMGVLIDDCLGTSDERLAMRRLDDLLREVERGEYQTGKKLFEKACDHYEAAVLKKRSESVQELHAGVIRNHLVPEFRGRKLSEIDQMDVLKYFQKHAEVCESTLKKRFRVLKEIMRMKNPMYELPPMQFKNKGRRFDESQILELEDVKRIADSVHPPYRPMCLVAAYSGLRLGNIVALQKRNVDLKDGWIKVRQTKTGKPVSVPICRGPCVRVQAAQDFTRRRIRSVFPGRKTQGRVHLRGPDHETARVSLGELSSFPAFRGLLSGQQRSAP